MLMNIILIILIIIVLFFTSNEEKVNDLVSKKHIKYLLLLLIIYFVYQNYSILILVIAIMLFIFVNMSKNKYMDYYENFKNLIKEYYQDRKKKFLNETSLNGESTTSTLNESFTNENKSKNKIEPFREEVTKLKELYDNIKSEIKKLG